MKPICPACKSVDHGAILPADHGGQFYFTRCGQCGHGYRYNAKGEIARGHEGPLPDVELTDTQDDRATALERAVIERPASAACLIVHLQDKVAELERNWSGIFGERDHANAAQWVADLLWNQRAPSTTDGDPK